MQSQRFSPHSRENVRQQVRLRSDSQAPILLHSTSSKTPFIWSNTDNIKLSSFWEANARDQIPLLVFIERKSNENKKVSFRNQDTIFEWLIKRVPIRYRKTQSKWQYDKSLYRELLNRSEVYFKGSQADMGWFSTRAPSGVPGCKWRTGCQERGQPPL